MMTRDEMNDVLNRFMGWKPGLECDCIQWAFIRDNRFCCARCGWISDGDPAAPLKTMPDHNIPPINYFADTPEAREAVRLLKDEFVHQTHQYVKVLTSPQEATPFCCFAGTHDRWAWNAIEHHAIATAIAEALKEDRE